MNRELMISSNPSIYGLSFAGYFNKKISYSEPTSIGEKRIAKDISIFATCQNAIYQRNEIAQGDYVIGKDGDISCVTVTNYAEGIQVGGVEKNAVYISKNGYGSYSGTCGRRIEMKNILPTDQYKKGYCWIFSGGSAGGGRGVTGELYFKVWKEI